MEKEKTKELLYAAVQKILEADQIGNAELTERIYNNIKRFILNDEKEFINKTDESEEKFKADITELQKEWKKATETVLEGENMDECIVGVQQGLAMLQQGLEGLSIQYKDDAIESTKSYHDRL